MPGDFPIIQFDWIVICIQRSADAVRGSGFDAGQLGLGGVDRYWIDDLVCQKKKSDLMSILLVLIVCSILVAAAFLAAFIYSVKSGQFDDTYSPGHRILFDDHLPDSHKNNKENSRK